jgi:hypothetical protein
MPKNYVPPVETIVEEGSHLERKRYTHPAFAVMVVGRPSGHATLFQSALQHQHYVSIEIKSAEVDRDLNHDWVHSRKTILRFSMSEAQWAQAVASPGMGSGVPITLEYAPPEDAGLVDVPGITADPVKKKFSKEIKAQAQKYVAEIVGVVEQLQKDANENGIPKGQLKERLKKLGWLVDGLPGNLEFIQNSFAEAMEKTVQAGKIELESFALHVAQQTGVDVLKNAQPKIIEQPTTKILKIGGKHGNPVQEKSSGTTTPNDSAPEGTIYANDIFPPGD